MAYEITGLPVEPFRPLFGLSDAELAARGMVRVTADAPAGYPCRVTLEDAAPGETLLLVNHEYQPAPTPYQGRHAIFVNERATQTRSFVDEVPAILSIRKAISLRAFDVDGMMVEADVVPGAEVEAAILRLLANPDAAYIHAHNAGRGCYAARIDRTNTAK
jgi:hypothetical protein